MKWFKHMTDSRHDAFIRQLEIEWKAIYKSAAEGVGLWWRLIELIAEMMDDEKGPFIIINKKYLFHEMYLIREQKWNRFRMICERFEKINVQDLGDDLRIECPNIKKIKDEWTLRKDKKREKTRELSGSNSVSPINRVLYKDNSKETSLEYNTDNSLSKAPEDPAKSICVNTSKLGFPDGTIVELNHGGLRYTPKYQECVKHAKDVIAHLNHVTGKNARMTGYGFNRAVTLLWNDIPASELIAVIDKKNLDPKFERRYMVADTLFKPELFEKYQMECIEDYQSSGKPPATNFQEYDEFDDVRMIEGGVMRRQPDGSFLTIMDEEE
jgi:hypothetical protein